MDTKSGVYNFQLDELQVNLDADLLHSALGITAKDFAYPFMEPRAGDLCRFSKLIICYLRGRHNIYKRPQSPLHITADDYSLDNLKFFPKGKLDEVFGLPIPKDLITDEEGGKKKKALPASKSKHPTRAKKPALAKQTKHVKEKTSKPYPSKKIRKGKVMKVRKGKMSNHLVDEEDEEEPVSRVAIRKPVSGITQQLPVVKGKGKGIIPNEQATQSLLDLPSAQPQDDTSTNVVCDTPSLIDVETGADMEKSNSEMNTEVLYVEEEHGEEVSNMMDLEERTVELDEGQARLDPGKTTESRPLRECVLMEEDQAGLNPGQSHVVQAGPNLEPMHEDFIATIYPQVHESLKLTTEEHVHIENPPSSSGTLSSMKNLDDAFTFGDQFLNDKSSEEELRKANVETEVESMVTVPIHQASSSVPPLSTPIIDLTPLKPVSPLA
ncbi:hypothetical protein Tco_0381587 [Tanacetum coccineum]